MIRPNCPSPGTTILTFADASLVAEHAGHYVRLTGTSAADGAFPILDVPTATSMLVAGFASREAVSASYTIVAGVGPVPANPRAGTPVYRVSELTRDWRRA